MKNYLKISFVLVTITSFIIYSCTNEEKTLENEQQIIIENFENVGKVHNDGLDFIFSDKTFDKISLIAKSQKNNINGIDTLAIANIILEQTNDFLKKEEQMNLGNLSVDLEPISNITDYFDIVKTNDLGVYFQCEGSSSEVIACIDSIMNEYRQNPDREDYNLVMSSGELYKHSVDYWSSKESRKANFNRFQQKGWFNWAAFAKADAVGAWGGAEIGIIGGPSGAVGGAVAFGLMGSATNAAVQAAWHEANGED